MYNFVVCGIFKNESHILKEWIEHYLFHGVDYIYLINDFSTDNYIDIIEQYPDKITLYHNDIITDQMSRQNLIFNRFCLDIMKTSKWFTLIDLDEFLYSPIDINLQNVLQKYEQYNSITIEYYWFGSNGHSKQPISVVEGFIKRKFKEIDQHPSHKFIIKSEAYISYHVHYCNVNGPWTHLYLDNHHNTDFIINHYVIQSKEWFMKVKHTRGDCDNWYKAIGLKSNSELRNENYFNSRDTNDVLDVVLLHQNQDCINKLFYKTC